MKIEININEVVEFELTAYGAKILNDKNEWYRTKYPQVMSFQEKEYYIERQLLKRQLWSVMQDFGEHTSLGLETFCKNATITFEIKDE